jgi:hypothetical protein
LLTEQALLAVDELSADSGESPAVFTMPWITSPLTPAALAELQTFHTVFVVENHNPARAKHLLLTDGNPLGQATRVHRLGLEGIPQNGQPGEVLASHGLDASHLEALLRKEM